jgi:SP family arabinose:H+ symporter-like MFS transporter
MHLEVIENKKNYYMHYMEDVGMTKYAWIVFTIASFLQFIWGCETCFISINIERLAEYKSIPTHLGSLFIMLLYTMMGFGSALVGILTKHFGRIFTLQMTTLIFILFTISCSFFTGNFYLVLISRCISNISIGVFNIVILNLMSEYLPIKNRCFILMVNSGFYNLGNLFMIFLNYLFFDDKLNLTTDTNSNTNNNANNSNNIHTHSFLYKWNFVNILTTIPGVIALIMLLIYTKESPLYLLNKNKDDEAFEIIQSLSLSKNKILSEEEKIQIKKSITDKKNYYLKSFYRELFYPEYISLTLNSLVICSICYLNMIGITYLVPKSIKELGEAKTYNMTYSQQLIIYGLLQLPNGFIGGWMTESQLFGRKNTILLSSIFCGFFYLLCFIHPRYICFYAGQIMLFNSIAFGCAFIYVTEAFPTNIRDHAQSFIQFFSFLLGSWSPYLIDYFPHEEILINFILLGVTCFICALIAFFLRIETKQRPLDEDI